MSLYDQYLEEEKEEKIDLYSQYKEWSGASEKKPSQEAAEEVQPYKKEGFLEKKWNTVKYGVERLYQSLKGELPARSVTGAGLYIDEVAKEVSINRQIAAVRSAIDSNEKILKSGYEKRLLKKDGTPYDPQNDDPFSQTAGVKKVKLSEERKLEIQKDIDELNKRKERLEAADREKVTVSEKLKEKGTEMMGKSQEKTIGIIEKYGTPEKWSGRWLVGEVAGNAPSTIGSFALGVTTALITKNPTVALAVGFGYSWVQEGGGAYAEAREAGVDEAQAQDVGAVVGTINASIEMIPLGYTLNKNPKIKSALMANITNFLINRAIDGTFEGGTETIQEIVGNAMKKTYDENQSLFEGLPETFVTSFVLGVLGGVAGEEALSGNVVKPTIANDVALLDKKVLDKANQVIEEALVTPEESRTETQQKIVEDVTAKYADKTQTLEQETYTKPTDEDITDYVSKRTVKFREDQDLLSEAKRYKSAEEFINKIEAPKQGSVRLYRGMTQKFDEGFNLTKTDAPTGYSTWTDNKRLAEQYAGRDGFVYEIDMPKKQQGKELINMDGERVLFLDNEKMAGLNNISGKEYLIYNNHELYNPSLIKESKTKSQLTDIWNKANRVPITKENYANIAKESSTTVPIESLFTDTDDFQSAAGDSIRGELPSYSKLPVLAKARPDGKYDIIDGNRRTVEALNRGDKSIDIITDEALYRELSVAEEEALKSQRYIKGEDGKFKGSRSIENEILDYIDDKTTERFRTSDRIKDDFEKIGIKITDAQEKKIIALNKKFFGDSDIRITMQMLANNKALGSYYNNMIKILSGQVNAKDTFYHEAVHKYIDTFLTTEEQIELFKAGIEKYGTENLAQVEEKLAEDFIAYAKSREGITGKIKLLFDKLLSRVQSYLGNKKVVDDMYAEIITPVEKKKTTKKITKTAQKKATTVEAPKVYGRGQKRISKLGVGVETKAIQAELVQGFADIPEYRQMSVENQIARASKLLKENPESAIAIALGKEQPKFGLAPEAVFKVVEDMALQEGRVDLLRQLASSERVSEATVMGQRIRLLAERNPDSAVNKMIELVDARKKAIEKAKGYNVDKEVKNIKKEIDKKVEGIKKGEWLSFIDSIQC
jgi:hypothetical protein